MVKDTKGGKLEDVIKEWLIIQWSKDTKGEIRRRNQRMTNNTMVKRYQRGNQKRRMTDKQWSKDTKGEIRRRNQRMTDTMAKRYN